MHASETKKRAELIRRFKDEIEEGYLSIVVCKCPANSDQFLLQLLAKIDSDWVVMSSNELYEFASLQLQLRRLAEKPSVRFVDGAPRLLRREHMFDLGSLADLSMIGMFEVLGFINSF